MNQASSTMMSVVAVLVLASRVASAGSSGQDTKPIDWVRVAFGTSPVIYKSATGASLAVVMKGPDKAALSQLTVIAKTLAQSATREKPTESVCLAVAEAKGVKKIAQVMLTASQYADLTRSIPSIASKEVGLAINLKAAGLTTEPVFLNIQPDEELRGELLAMAATGTVRLSARLLKAPTPEQTAMARIETDKGSLGLKMVLEVPDLKLSENQLVFSTPSRRSISVPLLRLPRLKEVLSNLVTAGGLAKLVSLRLAVGADAKAGFVVDFRDEESQVPEFGKQLGAVPVDGIGRAVGPAVYRDWAPVVRSSHALRGDCKHTLTLVGVGEEGFVASLKSYYPGDEAIIERVLEFDPATQTPAEQFGRDEACISEQGS